MDDKPYFTYYNTVLNVIYQHAAVYKLTVSFCYIFKSNVLLSKLSVLSIHARILIVLIKFICDRFVFDIQLFNWTSTNTNKMSANV